MLSLSGCHDLYVPSAKSPIFSAFFFPIFPPLCQLFCSKCNLMSKSRVRKKTKKKIAAATRNASKWKFYLAYTLDNLECGAAGHGVENGSWRWKWELKWEWEETLSSARVTTETLTPLMAKHLEQSCGIADCDSDFSKSKAHYHVDAIKCGCFCNCNCNSRLTFMATLATNVYFTRLARQTHL